MAINSKLSFISFFLFFSCTFSTSLAITAELAVGSFPSKLLLHRRLEGVVDSNTAAAAAAVVTSRVYIHGLSRLRNLSKFAHALKVKVSVANGDGLFRSPNIELCFHRNLSRPIGACPADHWQKLSKGSWAHTASPFGDLILDIRIPPDLTRAIEVSTEEEFLRYRVVFLVMGTFMIMIAHFLSEWAVFYYGSAMAVGVILVILMILYQGMRLLPTGRKSSLAIFMYSSLVGVATFLMSYVSRLLRSVLADIGISEDMHNPLAILLLVCIILAGAWFGYWGVRKLVLTEDGLVDSSVAYFIEWAILIFSAVMILQCSLDALLGLEGLLAVLALTKLPRKTQLFHHIGRTLGSLYEALPQLSISSQHESLHPEPDESDLHRQKREKFKLASCNSSGRGYSPDSESTPSAIPYEEGTYYSTFHQTPERRKFTKEEWDSFTKDHTRKALRELVSSPDFSRWAAANAERITVTPPDYDNSKKKRGLFRWF